MSIKVKIELRHLDLNGKNLFGEEESEKAVKSQKDEKTNIVQIAALLPCDKQKQNYNHVSYTYKTGYNTDDNGGRSNKRFPVRKRDYHQSGGQEHDHCGEGRGRAKNFTIRPPSGTWGFGGGRGKGASRGGPADGEKDN